MFINKVKEKEEQRIKHINEIIDQTVIERQNKDKIVLEEKRNLKKQVYFILN